MAVNLEALMPAHAASLHITHNDHKGVYESAEEWAARLDANNAEGVGCYEWVSDDQKRKAIEQDSIWTVQWYPNTPVGFNALAGADLEVVLAAARAE